MLRTRVIPCLLLQGQGLVKSVKFKNSTYVGDPVNAVKIFNDKEADEILLLDITATPERRGPNFKLIAEIASESFMPLGYGGGIRQLDDIKTLFNLGVEKVAINSHALEHPVFIKEATALHGNQSIVVSIDVKRSLLGKYEVHTQCGRRNTRRDPVVWAQEAQEMGAGEILLNSIDRDGMMQGGDLDLIRSVTQAVRIPVVACGGFGSLADLAAAAKQGGASGVAAGSLFVFYGKHRAVLINYPSYQELERALA